MKILLDKNIDIRFKNDIIPFHEVYTVKDMSWNGIKNGELLKLIEDNNFDAWIVADKNIIYQQNLSNIKCTIIVLNVYRNTLKHLILLTSKILEALQNDRNPKVIFIEE